jgi:hypothetical protein
LSSEIDSAFASGSPFSPSAAEDARTDDAAVTLSTTTMRLFAISALAAGLLAGTGVAALVKGRSFDRFITIWLENEVRPASPACGWDGRPRMGSMC